MKRIWVLLLMAALLLSTYSTAWAAEKVVASGSCGKDVTWTLNDSGLLTISGSGAMTDYSVVMFAPAPWAFMKVKTVEIESGVTSIGDGSFSGCNTLTDVYFTGTEAQWNALSIDSANLALDSANILFSYRGDDSTR